MAFFDYFKKPVLAPVPTITSTPTSTSTPFKGSNLERDLAKSGAINPPTPPGAIPGINFTPATVVKGSGGPAGGGGGGGGGTTTPSDGGAITKFDVQGGAITEYLNKYGALPSYYYGSKAVPIGTYQQLAQASSETTPGGFSGSIQESFQGTPESTTYYVQGREVGKYGTGQQTFTTNLSPKERANIKFNRQGTTREVNISSGQLQEVEYQTRQQSATDFLLGGGTPENIQNKEIKEFPSGTRTTNAYNIPTKVYSPGTIYEAQTGSFKPFGSKNEIPITQIYTVQEDYSTREATNLEIKQLQEVIRTEGYNRVALESPKGIINSATYNLRLNQQELQTKGERGNITPGERGKLFVTGALQVGFGTIAFGRSLSTQPIQTIKSIPGSTIEEFNTLISSIKSPTPEYAFGRAAGYYIVGKGIKYAGKGVVRVSDYVRTSKLTEIPMEDVVAPEYLKGQKYPAISKGQTAGELLKEFIPANQYGVTRLSGFTASPKPFARETIAAKGTSELPGVYQAPKLSAAFLRLSSEQKSAITFNLFGETLRPSATIIKPTEFKLAKVVNPSQRNVLGNIIGSKVVKQPLIPKNPLEFFKRAEIVRYGKTEKGTRLLKEFESGTGKSIIPFIKTEKEAVIPAETPLNLISKRFFFRFEGRRIPIYEFEALKGTSKGITNIYSTAEVSRISSYRAGSSGYINPADILNLKGSDYSRQYTSKSYNPSKSSVISYTSISKSFSQGYSREVSSSSGSLISSSRITPSKSSISSRQSSKSSVSSFLSSLTSRGASRSYVPKIPQGPSYTKMPSTVPKLGITKGRIFREEKKKRSIFGNIPIFGRRFGKFKTIGLASTIPEAVRIGKEWSSKTLGVSFKIPGFGGKVQGYKTKIEKGETIFIEPEKRRIKRGTKEYPELSYWKKVKGGKY